MQETRTVTQESAEDIFFGQVVTIWARWFLIVAGVFLTLWVTTDPARLAVAIIPVVALVAVNFYLHGRYLVERPANPALITLVGFIDLAIVTTAVLVWPGEHGFHSPYYVLYFPVLLAFAFVMPRKLTIAYTAAAIAAYVGVSLLAALPSIPPFLADVDSAKAMTMRLIVMSAMGGLGTYYWTIQRNRRRALLGEEADVTTGPHARERASVNIDHSVDAAASEVGPSVS